MSRAGDRYLLALVAMVELKWQDPPPRRQGEYWLEKTVAELRANPGRWALVRHYDKHTSANNSYQRLKAAGCEATQRRTPDGGADLYARWPA